MARATVLSDYTFAVRAGDRFLNVGKAYSGLTDEEIRQLTRLLRASQIERYGRVLTVRPEMCLEVAFDGIQKSPRHKSGYAMRFPRIVRVAPGQDRCGVRYFGTGGRALSCITGCRDDAVTPTLMSHGVHYVVYADADT